MTLRQLAADLGLGKTTVADALRGKYGVSEATRTRVLERAAELGYKPNPLTCALLRQIRTQVKPRVQANVAALVDSPDQRLIASTAQMCNGIQARGLECGLAVDVMNTYGRKTREIMKILLSRGVEAIALMPLHRPVGHRSLDWSKFAAVRFGYSMARPTLHQVVHNHYHGIRTAFRRCLRRGYHRIGLAMSESSNHRSNGLWLAGYLESQQHQPKTQRIPPLVLPDNSFGTQKIGRWLKQQRPEVVILHRRDPGKGLPDIFLEHSSPAIPVLLDHPGGNLCAGIDQRFELLGATMAEILTRLLLQNERGIPTEPTITHLEGRWIDHPSLSVNR